MNKKQINTQFFKFIIPSMLTMLLNGLYTIVDGFFVGNVVGDIGLAAIGLVWPITAILIALGMGIGVGGSVLMSTYRGAGDNQKANEAMLNIFFMLIFISITATIFFLIFGSNIVKLLGAKGKVYNSAISYIRIIALGGSMQIIASGLIPIIRNNHKTMQAMLIMGGGLIANIVLDALLTIVIPMELAGAALATILAQALTVICSLICLWREKDNKIQLNKFKLNKKMIIQMIQIGIAPFGLSLMPSLITVFNNWQCLAYGGDIAVSAYSVMNYFVASVLMLLTGIGEGIQPLISYYNGAKDYKAMNYIRNKGFYAIIVFSVLFLLFTITAKTLLPQFFSTSNEVAKIIEVALPILSIAFPMMGIGKLFISYFYSCGETKFSILLVYLDPIIFTPLCIFILPKFWELNGVWLSLPVAQLLIMILLAILFTAHTIKCKREKEFA